MLTIRPPTIPQRDLPVMVSPHLPHQTLDLACPLLLSSSLTASMTELKLGSGGHLQKSSSSLSSTSIMVSQEEEEYSRCTISTSSMEVAFTKTPRLSTTPSPLKGPHNSPSEHSSSLPSTTSVTSSMMGGYLPDFLWGKRRRLSSVIIALKKIYSGEVFPYFVSCNHDTCT